MSSNPSPYVRIQLYFDDHSVRLADVLENTATLYEPLKLATATPATLVLTIDGEVLARRVTAPPCDGQPGDVIRFLRGA